MQAPTLRRLLVITIALSAFSPIGVDASAEQSDGKMLHALTVVPPSPVTDKIDLDIRGAIHNETDAAKTYQAALFLDRETPGSRIHHEEITVPPRSAKTVRVRWPTAGAVGSHTLVLTISADEAVCRATATVDVLPSPDRSTSRIGGAWTGIYHWSEQEGKRWNPEIRILTNQDWGEVVRGMHQIQMDVVVVQEVFRNQVYHGRHQIPKDGYQGQAFYPSRLYSGRMDITAGDPVEAILDEADRNEMSVFMGVGLYAWFDFSPGSLEWHKQLASELWAMYGHHPSFYGWYVSEEVVGGILPINSKDKEDIETYRREIVDFFREFSNHCHTFAPGKPVMLAPNCHFMKQAEETWRQLLQHCDIVCPFGFHRMPDGDVSGEEVAAWLQALCDDVGAHLWMDMEVFLFGPENDLYPRPIDGLVDDLLRFPNFEKILCYQYPGLLNAPWAAKKPGGRDTVKLFLDYERYIEKKRQSSAKPRKGDQ